MSVMSSYKIDLRKKAYIMKLYGRKIYQCSRNYVHVKLRSWKWFHFGGHK